jgi:hypothetical protein
VLAEGCATVAQRRVAIADPGFVPDLRGEFGVSAGSYPHPATSDQGLVFIFGSRWQVWRICLKLFFDKALRHHFMAGAFPRAGGR